MVHFFSLHFAVERLQILAECWLRSPQSSLAVWTEVAWIGHRATRDVRRTIEEKALREGALQFRPRRVEDV